MDACADRRGSANYETATVRSMATLGKAVVDDQMLWLKGCSVASDHDLSQVADEILSFRQSVDVLLDVEDAAENGDIRIVARLAPLNGFQGAALFSVEISPQQAATLASSLSMLAHLRRTTDEQRCRC